MKQFNGKFFGNIIITIVCVTTITLIGLKQTILYDDYSDTHPSFTLTNNGNISVDYIEGELTKEGLMRVQNGAPYTLALTLFGETETFEDFTFESQLEDVVFNMNYDATDQQFYLNRTLFMVKSFFSLSLLALVVLIVQLLYYVPLIFSFKKSSDIESDVFELTVAERLMRIPTMFVLGLVSVLGIIVFVELFINLQAIIFQMRDTHLLMIVGAIMLMIFAYSAYIALFAQHYQFKFEQDHLLVRNKGTDFFSSPYTNLVVEERITQSSNAVNKYTSMNLILKSKDVKTREVEMNLLFLGAKDYNLLVQRLHGLAKGLENEQETQEGLVEEGRFFSKKNNAFLVLLPLVLVFMMAISFMLIGTMDSTILIVIMMVIPISVLILLIVLLVSKNKEVMIKADMGGIQVNDTFIEASSIKKITMSRPTIGATIPSTFKIKHTGGRINMTLMMIYKKESFAESYRRLFVSINKNYGEVLNK